MNDFTSDELAFLESHFPRFGGSWCASRLDRPSGVINKRARTMGLIYGWTADFRPLKHVAGEADVPYNRAYKHAQYHGVLKVWKHAHSRVVVVPRAWANRFVASQRGTPDATELDAAGFLSSRQAAARLRMSQRNFNHNLTGNGTWSDLFAPLHPITTRQGRRFNPHEVEEVRKAMARFWPPSDDLITVKELAADLDYDGRRLAELAAQLGAKRYRSTYGVWHTYLTPAQADTLRTYITTRPQDRLPRHMPLDHLAETFHIPQAVLRERAERLGVATFHAPDRWQQHPKLSVYHRQAPRLLRATDAHERPSASSRSAPQAR